MKEKVKEFEKAAMDAVSALRNELGATSITMSIHIDNYEKGCRTDVSFHTAIPKDASCIPGCDPACKGD